MIKDITLGQYFPGDSLLHRADPRVKIVLTLMLMTILLMVSSYASFFMFAGLIFIAMLTCKIPLAYALGGVRPIMPIAIFTAVINIFMTEGNILLGFKFINITYEGLDTAAKMTIRLILLILGTSLMLLTTTPLSLTDGMERLFSPLGCIGVPVHELAMMINIAIRFIPTLLGETDKIMKAQMSRGVDFRDGNILRRSKNFIPILVPLFVGSIKRADELATAMEARCYRGGRGRTRMRQLKLSIADLQITLFVIIFNLLLIYVQYIRMPV